MEHKYWTKQELVDYFKRLSHEFEVYGGRQHDRFALGKAEAYEQAAFELEHNMEG